MEEKKAKDKTREPEKDKVDSGDNTTDETTDKDKAKDKDKDKDKEGKKKSMSNEDIASAEDFQLQRALDLLRAVNVYNQVTPEK